VIHNSFTWPLGAPVTTYGSVMLGSVQHLALLRSTACGLPFITSEQTPSGQYDCPSCLDWSNAKLRQLLSEWKPWKRS
jgi:hypothetical protein